MKFLMHHIFILAFFVGACNTETSDDEASETAHSIGDTSRAQAPLPSEFLVEIDPTDVSNDTNHIKLNSADLKVTLLLKNCYFDTTGKYGQLERKRTDIPEIDFGESLMWETEVTSIGNALYFSGTVCIRNSGACYNKLDGRYALVRDTIPTYEFQNYHKGGKIDYEIGELEVIPAGMVCMDTGRNKIAIRNDIGALKLDKLNNLKLFEFDLNKDDSKEIYVVSYATCMQFVTIYKIENRTI